VWRAFVNTLIKHGFFKFREFLGKLSVIKDSSSENKIIRSAISLTKEITLTVITSGSYAAQQLSYVSSVEGKYWWRKNLKIIMKWQKFRHDG